MCKKQEPTHRQREQGELYHVLSGAFELAFTGDGGEEIRALNLESGDFTAASSDEVRRPYCVGAGEVLVVGALGAKDDGVVVG